MADEFAEFVSRLTDNARTSLQQANSIARGYGSVYIGTEHLLLGILAQGTSVGAKLLADANITLNRAELALNLTPRTAIITPGATGLSETAKLTLKMAWDIAQEFHQDFLGTEHIIYSILSQRNARATTLLRDMGVDLEELRGELEEFLDRQADHYDQIEQTTTKSKPRERGALGIFGSDLTAKARAGELDPMIGRDAELERVVTILMRRTKNNPVLIGEPGVGKTAIVEGLARRIAAENVPDTLLDKRVIQLDIAAMIAGTKYRGEFEERLKKVVAECQKQKNILLFIDELHLVVGAGAAEGALDTANMLKPSLARGELHLIGATTLDEYRKHIEKDTALERRFQPIVVREPSLKNTLAILKGLRPHYEKHHGVSMSDEVLEDALFMADRYVSERFMPDKAIDVIDEAAARLRARLGQKPSNERDYKKQLAQLSEKMEDAVTRENYEQAALYKTRISQVQKQLDELHEKRQKRAAVKLSSDDIAQAIATMTGVPVERLKKSEASVLRRLEAHLGKYVIGQQEAIKNVARAIRRSRSGVSSQRRPIGSFVFMGPTGVGKTELARVLAREVFGSGDALIKIDMSEFGERHTTARLVGAPAGYVGYDDGGQLTDKIRRQPYSVVLFDEIEKAHPDVFNMMLQMLEDGYLTDAKGRKIDFTNTIVIMTSNIGAEKLQKEASFGFQATGKDELKDLEQLHEANKSKVEDELKKMMRPELLNRIDKTIVFHALTKKNIYKIIDLQIDELKDRLQRKGISVQLSTPAKQYLLEHGYDAKNGVRPLRRLIQDTIEDHVALDLLDEKYAKGDIIQVATKNSKLTYATTNEYAFSEKTS